MIGLKEFLNQDKLAKDQADINGQTKAASNEDLSTNAATMTHDDNFGEKSALIQPRIQKKTGVKLGKRTMPQLS